MRGEAHMPVGLAYIISVCNSTIPKSVVRFKLTYVVRFKLWAVVFIFSEWCCPAMHVFTMAIKQRFFRVNGGRAFPPDFIDVLLGKPKCYNILISEFYNLTQHNT